MMQVHQVQLPQTAEKVSKTSPQQHCLPELLARWPHVVASCTSLLLIWPTSIRCNLSGLGSVFIFVRGGAKWPVAVAFNARGCSRCRAPTFLGSCSLLCLWDQLFAPNRSEQVPVQLVLLCAAFQDMHGQSREKCDA